LSDTLIGPIKETRGMTNPTTVATMIALGVRIRSMGTALTLESAFPTGMKTNQLTKSPRIMAGIENNKD
jgi:hypothetical protein